MQPQTASRLGPYELLEEIGQGGFARVHRVRRDGRDYAAKILSLDTARPEPAAIARFEREIDVLGAIAHPNLLELVDSGVDPVHGPYLITPLIVGMTLRDLAAGRPLPPESALLLLEPVFSAVGAMHAAGLVHRDLKPENVMVTPSGDVMVVDLGLALAETHSRLTRSGTVTGSVPYMSPEQITGEGIGPGSDVWSLAVTLYELVAGRRPFGRERPREELAAILADTFEPLGASDRRVSPSLEAFLARCLERDPAARFASAREARDALLGCVDWCGAEGLRAQRAAVITDPLGYPAPFAELQVGRLKAAARAQIQAGDSFGALRALDRALAYRPDDEEILELVVEASERAPAEERGAVQSAARKLFGEHGPPASVEGFVDWVEKRLSDGLSQRPPPPPSGDAPAAGTPPARRQGGLDDGALVWVLIGGGGLLFIGAIFLLTLYAAIR